MGQKSNTLTLRSSLPSNLSFLNQNKESQTFLQSWKYLTFLERFLNKKNILVINREFNLIDNRYNLNLTLFFRTAKITGYRRKIVKPNLVQKKAQNSLLLKKNSNIVKTLLANFFLLKTNHVVLKIKSSNNKINETLLKQYYQKTSRFMSTLFLRKFSLYIDFLKLSVLFYLRMASAQTLLQILGQIFKVLPKRKHTRFLFFIKQIFHMFVDEISVNPTVGTLNIKGIKFIVNGKLQGKTRSSSSCIQVGAVPVQSIDKDIEFSRLHVYTLYGAFGFKIWIHRF